MAVLNFNANDVPESTNNFDNSPLPAGNYVAVISESEVKDAKSGGQYLQLVWTLAGNPKYDNKKLWDRLNLVNRNADAVSIAQRALRDIVIACGKTAVSNSEELHGIPVMLTVKIEPAKGDYAESNRIVGYAPIAKGGVPKAAASDFPVQTTAKPSQKAPWE